MVDVIIGSRIRIPIINGDYCLNKNTGTEGMQATLLSSTYQNVSHFQPRLFKTLE
jgi:hypothetical protein